MSDFRASANSDDPQESKLEAILKTAVAAIVTIDSVGLIDSANPATTSMFGYASDELLGQNVKVLMPEVFASQHDHYLANYLSTGEKKIIGIGREVTARRKDGSTFPVHLAVSEFQSGGKRQFAGIITDLSARYEAQKALTHTSSEDGGSWPARGRHRSRLQQPADHHSR
jgi:PAS domain S-box-containing protein